MAWGRVVLFTLQYCFVGALLALASGKAERRQVHPLKAPFAVQSGSVRRPIGFRSPPDRIPSAVQSDSVRRPIGLRSGDGDFS